MKKLIIMLCSIFVFHAAVPMLSVFAAETGDELLESSNVTITVVMPEPAIKTAPSDEPAMSGPAATNLYPSDVMDVHEGSGWQIVKTYKLGTGEKPEDIPSGSFERNGYIFTLADIICCETVDTELREHTETVTLNTETNELEKILPLLSPSIEYMSDDNYTGMITLDLSSIRVETAETKKTSYTMSITRQYPYLPASDISLVPKTVTDRGRVYTLAGVDWQAGNYIAVDYEMIPEYYTAVATYTAAGTSLKATGYVITALYSGTLERSTPDKTLYKALFFGEEICASTETKAIASKQAGGKAQNGIEALIKTLAGGEPGSLIRGALFVIILIIAIFIGSVYYIKKRKVNKKCEKS